jgi:hypothetical protein
MGWVRRATATAALLVAAGCGGDATQAPQATATPAAECARLATLRGSVEAALSGRGGENPQLELSELTRAAPAAIRPDIATIADAYGKLMPALDGIQEAPGNAAVERLQRAVSGLDQQALVAANERVTAWVTAHC